MALRPGSYYNPSAPGWGAFISPEAKEGRVVVGIFYTDGDGDPVWLVGNSPEDASDVEVFEGNCTGYPSQGFKPTRFGTARFADILSVPEGYSFTLTDERVGVSPPAPPLTAVLHPL